MNVLTISDDFYYINGVCSYLESKGLSSNGIYTSCDGDIEYLKHEISDSDTVIISLSDNVPLNNIIPYLHESNRVILAPRNLKSAHIFFRIMDTFFINKCSPLNSLLWVINNSGGINGDSHIKFTERENFFAAQIATGKNPIELVEETGTSGKAISFHWRNVLRKLGVNSRQEYQNIHNALAMFAHSENEEFKVIVQ